jgi:hypothetical protein
VAPSVVERYLLLGLRLGRHVEGIVDAYYGPPELAEAVQAEQPIDPRTLVSDAEQLLEELDEGWLRDQVVGARTYARYLAGESLRYPDEVEGCYGVRPAHTDESVFEAAHARLAELLPGDEPLAERYEQWREATRVPTDRVEGAVGAIIDAARSWTRGLVDLPDEEGVDLEIVRDKAWLAFCEYVGGLRSRISVNVDLPISAMQLVHMALHETYPGHHAERVAKDHGLVRGRGLLEETLVLVPTPQSLVSEGIAELAPALLLESAGGGAIVSAMQEAGIELDLAHGLAVERALEPCRWVTVNAALMLHEGGASEIETRDYMERWGLMTAELAAHVFRFLTEPTSRNYVVTYAAGRERCESYVGGDRDRFLHLLTEQIRVHDLVEARDGK